jgi:tetratricopeptide (TPR) repeat protein
MTQYYDRDELVDTTAMLALEACGVEPAGRSDYHNAFDAILKGQPEAIRTEILKRTPPDFLESLRKDPAVQHYRHQIGPPSQDEATLKALLSQARKAVENDASDDARNLLMQAAELQPHSFEPWVSLAFIEMRLRATGAAINAARKALVRSPDNPIVYTVLGIMLNNDYAHDAAAKAFSRALELNSQIQLALVELAKLRHDAGSDADAIELFQRAADLGSLADEDVARFGYLLSHNAEFSRAESMLTAALQADTSNEMARRVLVQILLENDRALEGGERLRKVAESSDDWEPWTSYAAYQLHALDDPDAAIGAVRAALERGYKAAPLYRIWAQALRELKAPPEAIIEIAERLYTDLPRDAATLTAQGQIYQLIDQWGRAEASFRAAGETEDAGAYSWLLLGRLLSRRPGRIADAEEAFRCAVDVGGEDAHCAPLKELAELRVHRGDDVEADTLLERALACNEECGCSLILRGEIASRRGDRVLAKQLLNKVLLMNAKSVPALTALARISDAEDAEALIDRAMKADPEDPRVLLARSRLVGRDSSARINDAQRAVEGDPELAEARVELALLLAQRGERENAMTELAEALRAIPSRMEIIPAFVNATLQLVRSGYLEDVEGLLQGEQGRPVEPLLVALRLYRGENPIVAIEIEDVAYDIVEQLRRMNEVTTH